MSPSEVEASFVGREPVRRQIVSSIRLGQNVLLAGERGTGKTTLLILTGLSLRGEPESFEVVQLPEELYGVGIASDFWSEVGEALHLSAGTSNSDKPLLRILNHLDSVQKKLVVLIDNIDLLCEQLGTDHRELVEVFCLDPRVQVVATTSLDSTEFASKCDGVAECFEWFQLGRLSEELVSELLMKRAALDGNERYREILKSEAAKVRALAYFTAGVPRLVLMLYRVTAHSDIASVRANLERLLDEVTPYYKSKIETLPPQLRRILDFIARSGAAHGTALTPAMISAGTKLPPNQTSAQLRRLGLLGYVDKVDVQGRNSFYALSEPLFSIWYQMRFGRTPRERLKWLVEFIRAWYTSQELRHVSSSLEQAFRKFIDAGDVDHAKDALEFRRLLAHAIADEGADAAKPVEDSIVRDQSVLQDKWPQYQREDERSAWHRSGERNRVITRRVTGSDVEAVLVSANEALVRKDWSSAITQFSQALLLGPNVVSAWVGRANAHRRAGDADAARSDYLKAVTIPAEDAAERVARVSALRYLGRHDEAIEELRFLLQESPDSYRNWITLGRSYVAKEDYEASLEAFSRATEVKPNPSLAWDEKAQVLMKLGRHGEALEAFDRALLQRPSSEPLRLRRAVCLLVSGRPADALVGLNQLSSRPEVSARVHALRGMLLHILGRPEQAVEALTASLDRDPEELFARMYRGFAYEKLGDATKSLEDLEIALTQGAEKRRVLPILRRLSLITGQFDRVVEIADAMLTEEPTNAQALVDRAFALYALQQEAAGDRDVLALCEHVEVTSNPWANLATSIRRVQGGQPEGQHLSEFWASGQSWSAVLLRVSLLEQSGSLEAALSELNAVTELPGRPGLFVLAARARVLMELNRLDEALAISDVLVTRAPESDDTWALKAIIQGVGGKLSDSLETCANGLLIHPESSELHRLLGLAHFECDELDKAQEALARACDLGSVSSGTWRLRGEIALAQRSWEQADRFLRRALELWPSDPSVLIALGRLRAIEGKTEEAMSFFEQAEVLSADPLVTFEARLEKAAAMGTGDEAAGLAEWESAFAEAGELPDQPVFDSASAVLNRLALDGRHVFVMKLIETAKLRERMLPLVMAIEVIRTGDEGPVRRLNPEIKGITLQLVSQLREREQGPSAAQESIQADSQLPK